MNSVLKYEKYALTRVFNEKMKEVGEVFEIASVTDTAFVLRNAKTKVAIGVVNFEDLEKYFVKAEDFKGWTPWVSIVGVNGQSDALYRTNRRRVEVKFLTNKVRAESCCHEDDEFDLFFGLQIAYTRCYNKVLLKRKEQLVKELEKINREVAENNDIIQRMISKVDK